MSLEFIFSTVSVILIFTTLYSYGLLITDKLNFKFFDDVFFKLLIGYIFIGTVTLVLHFFDNIGNLFSIFIYTGGILIFSYYLFKKINKEFFVFVIILILFAPLLFGFSDHPIDSNMYHHPFISYLKSEKIIFAIANLQFRFGHISFLQYVQSVFINDSVHIISFASINIIFYLSFIFFISKKIFFDNQFNYVFLVSFFISCFLLIKFARYREYGNDLIPLLICFYFLVFIIQSLEKKNNFSYFAINAVFPFFVIIFMHKISYSFAFLIFLVLIDYKNVSFKSINLPLQFVFLIILFSWLLKNYINTSCFAYPLELSCFSNPYFSLSGIAEPSKASFLTTIWSKGFIDHPNWRNLDLLHYSTGINWVPTWLRGHFIKILEIIFPLILIMGLSFLYLLTKKKIYFKNSTHTQFLKKILILYLLIFIGLCVWFFNAPIFRYGAFFIISFTIITFLILLIKFFNLKKLKNINYFKSFFCICIIFFSIKNCLRIYDSSNNFYPTTISDNYIEKFYQKQYGELILLKSPGQSCYYTKFICSHEITNDIKVGMLSNYYHIYR